MSCCSYWCHVKLNPLPTSSSRLLLLWFIIGLNIVNTVCHDRMPFLHIVSKYILAGLSEESLCLITTDLQYAIPGRLFKKYFPLIKKNNSNEI